MRDFQRRKSLMLAAASAVILTMASPAFAADEMPSREEMWQMLLQQQAEINELKGRLGTAEERVEATGAMVESVAQNTGEGGDGNGWWERTQIGGYGELHYNGGDEDEVDFHRFVLFLGHDFTDNIRLFSELELEHSLAGDGEPGEVELEQAYVEFDLNENHRAQAGLFLLPVGILNDVHEPTTFFGVERNPVETNIIPTTWWEAGVGLEGILGSGFSYDIAAHSGLDTPTTGASAFLPRSGRQKVAEANASDGAFTGQLMWTGMPGVELAVSTQYQGDITQGSLAEEIDALFFETHADLRRGPWGLRALYARWDLNGDAPEAVGRDEQYGWYVEPSYIFDTEYGDVGLFARYNEWDNAAGGNGDSEFEQIGLGVNYWPHENVVLKADYVFIDGPTNADDDDRLNLGLGFTF